eukprot:Rmarinus@m.23372
MGVEAVHSALSPERADQQHTEGEKSRQYDPKSLEQQLSFLEMQHRSLVSLGSGSEVYQCKMERISDDLKSLRKMVEDQSPDLPRRVRELRVQLADLFRESESGPVDCDADVAGTSAISPGGTVRLKVPKMGNFASPRFVRPRPPSDRSLSMASWKHSRQDATLLLTPGSAPASVSPSSHLTPSPRHEGPFPSALTPSSSLRERPFPSLTPTMSFTDHKQMLSQTFFGEVQVEDELQRERRARERTRRLALREKEASHIEKTLATQTAHVAKREAELNARANILKSRAETLKQREEKLAAREMTVERALKARAVHCPCCRGLPCSCVGCAATQQQSLIQGQVGNVPDETSHYRNTMGVHVVPRRHTSPPNRRDSIETLDKSMESTHVPSIAFEITSHPLRRAVSSSRDVESASET